ncbi:MAG: hypothetical protein UX37_C0022G0014 [Microgenomates group bacterium GW2011_GWA2_46_16]|nr:MAG: hypothetical protein UX37_C0022G0014 [Microgenomates group bacterium GW2011_GWA2_46_16]
MAMLDVMAMLHFVKAPLRPLNQLFQNMPHGRHYKECL